MEIIDDRAFMNCSGLTSVTIGKGMKRIGHLAFAYCKKLKEVIISGNPEIEWDAIGRNSIIR